MSPYRYTVRKRTNYRTICMLNLKAFCRKSFSTAHAQTSDYVNNPDTLIACLLVITPKYQTNYAFNPGFRDAKIFKNTLPNLVVHSYEVPIFLKNSSKLLKKY